MKTPADPSMIASGSRVRVEYRILLEDGSLVEAGDDPPLDFSIGDDALPEAIQHSLLGMRAGETGSFEYAAFEVWGPGDSELRQTLPLDDFAGATPDTGQIIEFALPDGRTLAGAIQRVGANEVEVDFNHPLHDRNIRVDVRILAVEEPN